MNKQLLLSMAILIGLLLGTAVVIMYGKGYRFNFSPTQVIEGTGLLVTTSSPNGAEVFINGHLTTATDTTINLAPGEYSVKIFKEGYFPWQKKIRIEKEVVSKAEALLFPVAPTLESLTSNGAANPVIDPSFGKIAFTSASGSAAKENGLYVIDLSNRPILTLQGPSTQIADDTVDQFSKALISWSPDGASLLATISATPSRNASTYLLNAANFNSIPKDVSETLAQVWAGWNTIWDQKNTALLNTFKAPVQKIIQAHFTVLTWSPDETKVLYRASDSATLPVIITPRLMGSGTLPENRTIEKDSLYVYDTKEDRNFMIPINPIGLLSPSIIPTIPTTPAPVKAASSLTWFSDSRHLLYVHDNKIDLMEYDGSNNTTLYAGPFIGNYVFPSTNGSKLIILTNLNNPSITPNLYTIGLK